MTSSAPVVLLTSSSDEESPPDLPPQELKFYITGKPQSMPRPAKKNGKFYNPANADLKKFKAKAKEACGDLSFPKDQALSVTLWFLMPPPQDHFYGTQKLRKLRVHLKNISKTLDKLYPANIREDIDNLAKFTLDGLNGIAFSDDKQVIKLEAYKMMDHRGDDQGECVGRTIIHIEKFNQSMVKPIPTTSTNSTMHNSY